MRRLELSTCHVDYGMDEGPMTPDQRRQFFLDLVAWGRITDQTRLIFVGIEDGGKGWVHGKAFWKVDDEILDCQNNADSRFVPGRYVAQCGPSKFKITEQVQCHFSLELRRLLRCPPCSPLDPCEYYHQTFLNGFELAANLYPIAKRKSTSDIDPRTCKYLGFEPDTSINDWRQEVIKYRLEGICSLRNRVSEDGRPVILVLMGKPVHSMEFRKAIIGDEDNGDTGNYFRIDLRRAKAYAECFKKKNIIYCLTPHPSFGWFSKQDATTVVEKLSAWLK